MITLDQFNSSLRLIEIRNGMTYQPECYVEDGKKLCVHMPGKNDWIEQCEYIDPYHFGPFCYHVDQFAEFLVNRGAHAEPVEYLTDLQAYRKIFPDRSLKGPDGKIIPYHAIVGYGQDRFRDPVVYFTLCPEADYEKRACISDRNTGEKTFMSMAQLLATKAYEDVNLTDNEQKLLRAVTEANHQPSIVISQAEYDKIPEDYKDIYQDYQGNHPEWVGRRTAFLPGHGTTLYIEGISFAIGKNPSLDSRLKSAAKQAGAPARQKESSLEK